MCHYFFGSLFSDLIFVFVGDLVWEHKEGHMGTGEDSTWNWSVGRRVSFL